jgi:hydrogen peroxide-dependent heme synthase
MTAQQVEGPNVYSVFWVLRRAHRGDGDRSREREQLRLALQSEGVRLRGAYSLAGLRPDADAILWLHGSDLDAIQNTWTAIIETEGGRGLEAVNTYLGVATPSQYVADHSPAFIRGVAPKRYLSVYPFVKTADWYLLPYTERQRLMREHGELGREFPDILTNTVSSFGLADQEFVVAIEGDDPGEIMQMMQRLRAAEVRKYTTYDTPIYLGRRMEIEDVLEVLV